MITQGQLALLAVFTSSGVPEVRPSLSVMSSWSSAEDFDSEIRLFFRILCFKDERTLTLHPHKFLFSVVDFFCAVSRLSLVLLQKVAWINKSVFLKICALCALRERKYEACAAATDIPRGHAEPTWASDLDIYNDNENDIASDSDNDKNDKNDKKSVQFSFWVCLYLTLVLLPQDVRPRLHNCPFHKT